MCLGHYLVLAGQSHPRGSQEGKLISVLSSNFYSGASGNNNLPLLAGGHTQPVAISDYTDQKDSATITTNATTFHPSPTNLLHVVGHSLSMEPPTYCGLLYFNEPEYLQGLRVLMSEPLSFSWLSNTP